MPTGRPPSPIANGTPKDLYSDAYGNLVKVDEHNGASTITRPSTPTTRPRTSRTSPTRSGTSATSPTTVSAAALPHKTSTHQATPPSATGLRVRRRRATSPRRPTPRARMSCTRTMTSIVFSSKTLHGQGVNEVTYTYDSGTDGIGHLSSATTTSGATQYQYNPLGLMKSETKTVSGTSFTTKLRLRPAGELNTHHVPR